MAHNAVNENIKLMRQRVSKLMAETSQAADGDSKSPADHHMDAAEALVIIVSTAQKLSLLAPSVVLASEQDLRQMLESSKSEDCVDETCEGGQAQEMANTKDAKRNNSAADLRPPLTAAEAKKTNLDGLELRCTNADPNYGVSWFQCRGHPSETARQILRRAKTAMAYEMEALGTLYLSAIYRRKMVEAVLLLVLDLMPNKLRLEEALKEAEPLLAPSGHSDDDKSRGSETSDNSSKRSNRSSSGSEGSKGSKGSKGSSARKSSKSGHRGGSRNWNGKVRSRTGGDDGDSSRRSGGSSGRHRREEERFKVKLRESEAWECTVKTALRRAPPVSPLPHGTEGEAFTPGDFTTGLLCLHRFNTSFDSLGHEHRRKILFGSDQITP